MTDELYFPRGYANLHTEIKIKLTTMRVWTFIGRSHTLARLSQRIWTATPRGTVNQELKLLTMHLILNWLGW